MRPSCPLDPNMVYRAPAGTEDQCADLHVRRGEDETFGRSITSAWVPDAEELHNLQAGHSVTVTVFAQHQPVMSVNTEPALVTPDLFQAPPLQGVIGWAQMWFGPGDEYAYTFDMSLDAARDRLPVDGWRKDGDVFPVKDAR